MAAASCKWCMKMKWKISAQATVHSNCCWAKLIAVCSCTLWHETEPENPAVQKLEQLPKNILDKDVCWFFTQPYFWWWCPLQGWNVYIPSYISQVVRSWESNRLDSGCCLLRSYFFLPLFPDFVYCPLLHFYTTVSMLQHQHLWALGLCG